jgi:hypothetical protein
MSFGIKLEAPVAHEEGSVGSYFEDNLMFWVGDIKEIASKFQVDWARFGYL